MLKSIFILSVGIIAFAWDGYDYGQGNYIEIEKGNLVRRGETIEIYDYGEDGGYKEVEVENISRYGNSVEIEVYDTQSGEYRTFDMDRDNRRNEMLGDEEETK